MKTKKLLSLLLLGLLCSIGNVWGDDYTETFTNPTGNNPAARQNGKGAFTLIEVSGGVSFGNSSVQIGSNGGSGSFTISTLDGSTIEEIRLTEVSGYAANTLTSTDGTVSAKNGVWTFTPSSAKTSVTFSMSAPSGKKTRIAPISVDITSDYEYLSKNFSISSGTVSCTSSDASSDLTLTTTGSASNNGISVGNTKTLTISSAGHFIKSIHFTYESHASVTYSASTGTCSANSWTAGDDTKTVTFTSSGSGVIVGMSVELADIPNYTITYNGNGKTSGSVPEDEDSPYYSGSTVTVLGNTGSLAKTGYAFMGWNSKDDGTGADFAPDGTFTITKDTVLYAKWAATYTVTYHANGSGEEDVVKNNATTIIANPFTYANHTFTGWNTQADGKGTSHEVGSSVSGNLELYAQWQASHALSVTVNDGDMGNAEAEETTVIEGQTTGITATPETGYRFVNWTIVSGTGASIDNVNDASATFTMGTTDASIRANFEAKTYTVTLNNQSATTAGTANVTTTYNASTNLTSSITCPEKTDYVFCGYYTATNGGGLRLIDNNGAWLASVTGYTDADKNWIKDGNVTLYAYWMKYATSIDMEQFVIDNKKSGDYQAYLDAHNFKYTNDKTNITLDSLDNNKPTQAYNYTYLGLKIKKDAAFVAALVPAGKIVTIKLGNMAADGKLFKDGVEYKTDLKGVANTSEKPAVYYFYSEEAAVYRFQTTSSGAAVLKQFLIEDTYSCAVTSGNWGTICLPYAMPASGRSGATFYSIVGKTASSVLLEEVTGDLAAGTPYIYQANSSSIVSNFTGNMQYAVQSASGLVGNMSSTPASVGDNKYIIYNNQVCKVNGATVTCPQYKAYIDLSGVSSLAPSRFIEIPLAPENATNIEDLEASDSVVKFIHNGQLLIKRDGITYDALGHIVK